MSPIKYSGLAISSDPNTAAVGCTGISSIAICHLQALVGPNKVDSGA